MCECEEAGHKKKIDTIHAIAKSLNAEVFEIRQNQKKIKENVESNSSDLKEHMEDEMRGLWWSNIISGSSAVVFLLACCSLVWMLIQADSKSSERLSIVETTQTITTVRMDRVDRKLDTMPEDVVRAIDNLWYPRKGVSDGLQERHD